MATIVISVVNDRMTYTQQTKLDGSVYQLAFRWNSRAGRWFMDISSAAGVALASGICLLSGVPLTYRRRETTSGMPPGHFLVYDETGAGRSPDLTTFGKEVKLVYIEQGGAA